MRKLVPFRTEEIFQLAAIDVLSHETLERVVNGSDGGERGRVRNIALRKEVSHKVILGDEVFRRLLYGRGLWNLTERPVGVEPHGSLDQPR